MKIGDRVRIKPSLADPDGLLKLGVDYIVLNAKFNVNDDDFQFQLDCGGCDFWWGWTPLQFEIMPPLVAAHKISAMGLAINAIHAERRRSPIEWPEAK